MNTPASQAVRVAMRGRESELLRQLLPDGQERSGEWWALNPSRGDKTLGSFSVALEGDRAGKWYDFADGEGGDLFDLVQLVTGCSFKEAVQWCARAVGMEATDPKLRIHRPTEGAVAEWKRRASSGEFDHQGCCVAQLAEAKRIPVEALQSFGLVDQPASGAFPARVVIPYERGGDVIARRYRADTRPGQGFSWERGSTPVLYGLDRLTGDEPRVLLVEGESDCWCLWHARIAAVGIPGAGCWRDEWAADLPPNARIVVVQEPDRAGEKLIERLRRSPLSDRLQVLKLPAKDAADLWLLDPDAGRFRVAIDQGIAAAEALGNALQPATRLALTWFKDTEETEPTYIWPAWVPRAATSVIGGKGGDGKGLVLCDLVARHTRGDVMPDGTGGGDPGRVLIISREDDPETALLPRLRIAGADMSRVAWSHGDIVGTDDAEAAAESMLAAAPEIEAAIIAHGFDWVIVDPLGAWIEEDSNSSAQVRAVIDPATRCARRTGCAFTFVAHLRKAGADDPADAFAGSRAVVDAVRCAIHLGRMSEHERTFAVVKSNGRRPDGPMILRLTPSSNALSRNDPPRVEWRAASEEDRAAAASVARRGSSPIIPGEVVLPLLTEAHQPLDDLARAGRRKLGSIPGATAAGIRDALLSLVADGRAFRGQGKRGQTTIGLAPAIAPETVRDRAAAAWAANPEASVREIADIAGCSHGTAQNARPVSNEGVQSSDQGVIGQRTDDLDTAGVRVSNQSPRAPKGARGVGHRTAAGNEREDKPPPSPLDSEDLFQFAPLADRAAHV